jgi:hypothetical protein
MFICQYNDCYDKLLSIQNDITLRILVSEEAGLAFR